MQLAMLMGVDNVPVSYDAAMAPYLPLIQTKSVRADSIPTSVCISTCRLTVTPTSPDTLTFAPALDLIPISDMDGVGGVIVSTLCICPLHIPLIPRVMRTDLKSAAEHDLLRTIPEHDLDLVMWVIGNALVDPVSRPRLLFLYGSGGQGKSRAIRTIISNLPGVAYAMSHNYLGDLKRAFSDDDKLNVALHRIVTYGDVEFTDGHVNQEAIKLLGGEDLSSTKYGAIEVSATGIFGSNTLWWPRKDTLQRWFARRMLAIELTVDALQLPPSSNSFSAHNQLLFASRCISLRVRLKHPPVTTRNVLLTIFGAAAYRATRGLIFVLRNET
ncbi:hypothetical protein DFJ73DRAFT_32055 [Zopfochytrium polystomum]|nr:hypothetical protein DFJ73DRAFT_32055 [Zopfochytrium polystomum]